MLENGGYCSALRKIHFYTTTQNQGWISRVIAKHFLMKSRKNMLLYDETATVTRIVKNPNYQKGGKKK